MGSIRTDKNPSNEVAHPMPNLVYTIDMSVPRRYWPCSAKALAWAAITYSAV